MNFEFLNSILDLATRVVTITGVPITIVLFFREKRKERIDREKRVFADMDERYIAFMELCLQHPDLDVFDSPITEKYNPTTEQLRIESALFAILISLFERAYIMFEGQHEEFRERQWYGWVVLMESYVHRKSFQRVWNKIGSQFVVSFGIFINTLIRTYDSKSQNMLFDADRRPRPKS